MYVYIHMYTYMSLYICMFMCICHSGGRMWFVHVLYGTCHVSCHVDVLLVNAYVIKIIIQMNRPSLSFDS